MYRLKILAGPNEGEIYPLHEGANSIGRHLKNEVVLPSSRVSKRHCILVASHGELLLKDTGSSNGTFVNGALVSKTQEKSLQHGDRISIGDFVIEVQGSAIVPNQSPKEIGLGDNVVLFPSQKINAGNIGSSTPHEIPSAHVVPKDLIGRIRWSFEHYVMPFFYGLALKQEWRLVCVLLFALLTVGNLALTVWPLVETSQKAIVRETARRAVTIAKELAEKNAQAFTGQVGLKADIGSIGQSVDVRLAVVTNLDLMIIAPAEKINNHLAHGVEAILAAKSAKAFRGGREEGVIQIADEGETVIAVEPVKIYNPSVLRNVAVGLAVVSLDTTIGKLALGDIGIVYSKSLVLSGLLAALIFLILYRLTLKPFEVLNEDVDKVLKGELSHVTHEFKFEELNPLWDVVGAALQRVQRGGGDLIGGNATINPAQVSESVLGFIQMSSALGKVGFVYCDQDQKVVEFNSMFEEITGIRQQEALGQPLATLARDQAFGSLISDLFSRCTAGGASVQEDFDFSGITYRIRASGLGSPGGMIGAYVLMIEKAEV